jgi:hypothetical protein
VIDLPPSMGGGCAPDPACAAVDAAERAAETVGPRYVPEFFEPDGGEGEIDALSTAYEKMVDLLNAAVYPAIDRHAEVITYDAYDACESYPPRDAEPAPRPCTPPPAPHEPPPFMSTDSAIRKRMPVATGVLKYFPDAQLLKAWVSKVGNDKHNPGEPLHWDKSKSGDEPDAEVRHMLDGFRGLPADPGLEPLAHLGHLASKAWRADAELQRACDEARAAYERGEDWRRK